MVVGQDKKFLGVIVVPSLEQFKDYGSTLEDLSRNDDVNKIIREEVKKLISTDNGFKSFEKVQDARLLPKAFEVGDEINNLFKLKRHVITEKYSKLIESMYE